MEIIDLLDPHHCYHSTLKSLHHKNAEDYFDDLVKKSNVNVEENHKTIKELKNFESLYDVALKKENSFKTLKVFLIVLTIISFISSIIMFFLAYSNDYDLLMYVLIGVGLVILSVVLILINVLVVNKELKKRSAHRLEMQNNVSKYKSIAYQQMRALNELFDYNMSAELMTKTCPLIQMDKNFDLEKYEYMHEKYGFTHTTEHNCSVVLVQSGSIVGNPFIIEKLKFQTMVNHTYHGSLTISWTETVRVNGETRSVTRTQTLHASVTAPKPAYHYENWLIYGNDAAGTLSFSRTPSNVSGLNEKKIDKIVEKGEKKLDDLVEKTLMDDLPGTYTKLGNVEFDVLFGAQDRDNEVEFRLLFTPLAQQSLLKLIKDKNPYGDDFIFKKKKNLNYIHSNHSDLFDISALPSKFEGYDVEAMKTNFVNYNNEYFKSIYFDLAPLLSIPLYQQQKPVEYIYKRNYVSNITSLEHEVMANGLNFELLKPSNCATDLILKTKFNSKCENADEVEITSYGFIAEPRLTYVSVYGGDGRYHQVPVHWYEYISTNKTSFMQISKHDLTRKEYNDISSSNDYQSYLSKYTVSSEAIYQRGLLSLLIPFSGVNNEINKLNSILKK